MTSLCLLECSICKQSLTKHSSFDDGSANEGPRNSETLRLLNRTIWAPVVTPCGHLFHKGCITEWFRIRRNYDSGSPQRGTCPTCRKVVAYHKLIRLYLNPSSIGTDSSSNDSAISASARTSRTSLTLNTNSRQNTLSVAHRSASQPSPSPAIGLSSSTSTNNFRIYNDFLNLRYGRTHDPHRERHLVSSHWNAWQGFLMEDNAAYEIYCENEDCRTLQNVYNVLVNEFKLLQRKLRNEMDISKMKTILVTSLQKEATLLKQDKEAASSKVAWLCLLSMWFISCCYAFFKK